MRKGPGGREIWENKIFEKEFLVFLSLDIFRVFEILATIFWMEGSVTTDRSRIRDENMNSDDPRTAECGKLTTKVVKAGAPTVRSTRGGPRQIEVYEGSVRRDARSG